jgi:Mrp family chromosome partitioning ATPase
MSTYSHLGASPDETLEDEGAFALGRRLPTFAELRERLFGGDNRVAVNGNAGLLAADGRSLHQRLAPVREALRRLVFDLLPATDGDAAPVWTLAGAGPRAGATTVAAVMAYTAAEGLGRPALLIEGDLRRPVLAGLLRVAKAPGLSDVLAGDASMVEAMQETPLHGLWLLAGGAAVGQPMRLLRSPVVNDLLDAARARFGAVVIDAPPAHTSNETPLLASWADRTLLVLACGQTALADARRAIDRLGPERETGVILNSLEPALPAWLERLLGGDGLR